jgi:phosphoenolpyruvate synthase/pyruvate phosphate dikinase
MSLIPNDGVGLARTEFIVTNHIGIHPVGLACYPNLKDQTALKEIALRIGNEELREFFVRRFSEGVARIEHLFSEARPLNSESLMVAVPTLTNACATGSTGASMAQSQPSQL